MTNSASIGQSAPIILITLFALSSFYAWALNWAEREWPELFEDFTIVTVVIGVGYTLFASGLLLGWQIAWQLAGIFSVSALPIAARSIINALRRQRRLNNSLEGENHDHEKE